MSEPAPRVPDPRVRPGFGADLRRATPTAASRGALVAALALVLGQIPPLAINLFGGELAIATQVRLGWFYTAAANVIGIEVDGAATTSSNAATVSVAAIRVGLLSFTAIVLWASFRAGAAAARVVHDRPVRRGLVGASVAVPYALVIGILGVLVELRLATGGILPSVTLVQAVPWESFVLPLLLGAFAGAAGGVSTAGIRTGGIGSAVAGGWRAFVTGLGLALIGLLVFVAVRPSALRGYVDQLRAPGVRTGMVYAGHQALTLPNQATLVMVAAMGGCDTVTRDGVAVDAVCLGLIPDGRSPADWLSRALAGDRSGSTRPAPAIAWGFLAVPAAAVVLGAIRASRSAGTFASAAARSCGAASIFAALMFVTAWASTITVSLNDALGGLLPGNASYALGIDPLHAAALSLGWGIVVGVPAASLASWRRRRSAGAGRPSSG